MEKELFNELLDSLEKLKEKQKKELFSELFKSIPDKNDSLFELWLYDNSGSVQDFCNENADLSSVQSKRKFLSALSFKSYKTKSEFIEYMSELYDNLY